MGRTIAFFHSPGSTGGGNWGLTKRGDALSLVEARGRKAHATAMLGCRTGKRKVDPCPKGNNKGCDRIVNPGK